MVKKNVNSSSYIHNLYLCYLQIVITFPSSSNLLKNSSTQETKDQKFLHLYTSSGWEHLIRKQTGLRVKRSEEWIMSEMQQTSFTSFSTCCTEKKKIVTTFVIIDLLSPDSMWISGWKDLNYSCSTVHQPKTVAVHCSRASWACSLCCCLSTSWLFTCRQSFIVFFDVQLSTTSLRSPTTGHLSTGFSWFPSV